MYKIVFIFGFLTLSSICMGQNNSATEYADKANNALDKQQFDKALSILSEGIEEMPDSISLYDMRGIIYEALRLYDDAIDDFTTAIGKTEDAEAKSHLLSNRGGTKSRIRDFQGAYTDLTKAHELDSTNVAALNNLAAVCDELGMREEAIEYLLKVTVLEPDFVPTYVNLGFIYQNMGNHEKAIPYFNKALELSPDEPLAYSNRSFSRLKTNDLKGAMKDINKSIKLYPVNSYAYKIRGLIYLEKGETDKACADLKEAIQLGYTSEYGDEVQKLREVHCNN